MVARRQERVRLEARPHGIVLAPAIGRAVVLAGCCAGLWSVGWPWTVPGTFLLAAAAATALRAVWRWERTRLIVTTRRLVLVSGSFRRRRADVPLTRIHAVDVEQGLLGRILGYGTLIAGDLEVRYVADPHRVSELAAG
jgi:uncharacterized membrane protein YdbT with pleckstrin-like domain